MLSGVRRVEVVNFPQAEEMLFILTGVAPQRLTGSIDKYHHSEHLRFVFENNAIEHNVVKAMLKLLGIEHCSELFKNIKNQDGTPTLELYITVAKSQFSILKSYFETGALLKLKNQGQQVKPYGLQAGLQTAVINILFNPGFIAGMKERNQDRYNLDGLMYYFSQLLLNSAPCFAHLKERGVDVEVNIALEVEQSYSDSEAQLSQEAAMLTPMRSNHIKRKREQKAGSEQPSSNFQFKRATSK